jgi:hypothetical protein
MSGVTSSGLCSLVSGTLILNKSVQLLLPIQKWFPRGMKTPASRSVESGYQPMTTDISLIRKCGKSEELTSQVIC